MATSLSSSRVRTATRPRLFSAALLLSALLIGGLDYGTWAYRIQGKAGRALAQYFFERQDLWVLGGYAIALVLLAIWAWGLRVSAYSRRRGNAAGVLIVIGIVAAVLVARLGRWLVFHDYSPSRDELMVEMAGAYLADGRIGWPVPPEWLPYSRAMMPEFYSPYGADTHWTAIYLPVHAAIRAIFVWFGDAALAAPVTLAIGLAALWTIARRLFPMRPDAQVIVMLMALTSTQLVATAMTPYAMTSHFAFDMIWLALVLRGGKIGHGLAGLVAILAAGLHQWHFPLLFMAPFIGWLLISRKWKPALFHMAIAIAMMVIWARLWPMLLMSEIGPPPPSDAGRTNGIFDKLESLFGRLDDWQPLLNNARLIAWNHLLLLPLALLSLFAVKWRETFRAPSIIFALGLAVLLGMGFSLYQGYGWGFRYMHGGIGLLCLLAGFGWTAVTRPGDPAAARLVTGATILSLIASAWLLFDTERYVRGYARAMEAIRATPADVVLVDIRGGYYMTDLVRFEEGRLGRPVVMALQALSFRQLDSLCATRKVAIANLTLFRAAGVHAIPPVFRNSNYIQMRRDHLDALGCGTVIGPPQAR